MSLGFAKYGCKPLFERNDEFLESAQRRKLDFAIDACRIKPGDRVLDIFPVSIPTFACMHF